MSKEQIVYSNFQDEKTMKLDHFIVYLIDQTIVFSKIEILAVAPFGLAEIPKVEYSYIYNLALPNESVYVNGKLELNISDYIKNGTFFAKEHVLVGQEVGIPRYNTYYFGYMCLCLRLLFWFY